MSKSLRLDIVCIFALATFFGFIAACSDSGGTEKNGNDATWEPPAPDVWEPDVADVFSPYGSGSGGSVADGGSTDDTPGYEEGSGDPCNQISFSYSNETASSVWVTGSFNDWAPTPKDGAWEMTQNGNDWTLERTILDRGRHYYKFVVDGEKWVPDPTNGQQVTDHLGGRRSVVNVCRPEPVPTCGIVNFDYRDSSASDVKLVGDFTEWETNAISMRNINGVWRTSVDLQPGVHQYKFIVDGTWKTDPENGQTTSDGEGGENSVVEVECPSGY